MRLPVRLLPAVTAALLVAACTGAAARPTPSAVPSASGGADAGAWLRTITSQAIPPANLFAIGPTAVITGDGTYVTPGPVAAIYPGPLVPNLQGRSISEAGRTAIIAEATRLGLLGHKKTDFRGVAVMPGAVLGRIELTVDGAPVTLTGEPDSHPLVCIMAPCEPVRGTPEAFGTFWRELAAPDEWLGPELGTGAAFEPQAYALLVGPAPTPDPNLGAQVADWPLDQPVATFGGPVLKGTMRCGIVSGADADRLRPALEAANELTQWVQDPSTNATFGITVRPIIAGEDPCAETFGA